MQRPDALGLGLFKFSFDDSIYCERLRPFGLYLPARFYKKRAMWGVIVGAIVGLLCTIVFTRGARLIVGINQSGNSVRRWVQTDWSLTELHEDSGRAADVFPNDEGWVKLPIRALDCVMYSPFR